MTGAAIAQLLIALGPSAIGLINTLIANWSTPMTPDQVRAALAPVAQTYDDYLKWAQAQLGKPPTG
jgi:hypothetical protein